MRSGPSATASARSTSTTLRGAESEEDARFCREHLGAEIVEAPPSNGGPRPSSATFATAFAQDRLRATGHTASDQVETILFRLATSGTTTGIRASATTASSGRS